MNAMTYGGRQHVNAGRGPNIARVVLFASLAIYCTVQLTSDYTSLSKLVTRILHLNYGGKVNNKFILCASI